VASSDFDIWQNFSVMWHLHGIKKRGAFSKEKEIKSTEN
jgi:hypothetical protein